MKISRTNLLATLKLASPALASNKNQVLELSHFWLDGEFLSAYDDVIGIRVGCKSDVEGGVPGDKVVGVLENSRARDVTLEVAKGGNMLLKAGSAHITLAMRPIKDWFWHPEVPDRDGFVITEEFQRAID